MRGILEILDRGADLVTSTGQGFVCSLGGVRFGLPFGLFQHLRHTRDEDVERFLRVLTRLGADEVDAVMVSHGVDRSAGLAQKRLAEEIVCEVHGGDALERVVAVADVLFDADADPRVLSDAQWESVVGDVTHGSIERASVEAGGVLVVDALVACGLCGTRGEAKRLIQKGGVSVHGVGVRDVDSRIPVGMLDAHRHLLIRCDRVRFAVLIVA